MKKAAKLILLVLVVALFTQASNSCIGHKKQSGETDTVAIQKPCGPIFNPDSAITFTAKQCSFGPRIMNSPAHDACREWIVTKFAQYGCTVNQQKTNLTGYDGTQLRATNIIAQFNPKATRRILICAHWDSRPWADNDPDSTNHKKPVLAANDGASGVALMLEIARCLNSDSTFAGGVDFVCFDAEDWGVPTWEKNFIGNQENTWALGAQYFAKNLPPSVKPEFGILVDMVGGEGAQFYQEGMSLKFAPKIVDKVWNTAHTIGYGSYFPKTTGGMVTDDHLPLNQYAGIPTIDIIAFYPDCEQSSFGPTWHTISDTMEHIDKNVMQAVGQTILQVLFTS